MTTPHIVLVHGAWCGGWSWEAVAQELRGRGFRVTVIEQLPSGIGNPVPGLMADAEYLRSEVKRIAEPVLLVGHSYGGMVISELSADPRVSGAVYLTAFLPQSDVSFIEAAGGRLARWIEVDEVAGTSRIAEAAAAKVVASGMNDEEASSVLSRLGSQSLASFTEQSTHTGWGEVPVTYIVCTEDRVIPESAQRAMAAREQNATVIDIATGHFPMFIAAEETADTIASAAERSN